MNQTHRLAPIILITATLLIAAGCGKSNGQTTVRLPEIIQPSTPAPTATATATQTPLPTPTPTPLPIQVISVGERHLRNGDWNSAILAFQQVISNPTATPQEQANAQLGLALASLKKGDFASALAILDTFATQFSSDSRIARAHFLRGEAKLGLSDWAGAIADYNTYLSMKPGLLDSYVNERIADAYLAQAQNDLAFVAYDQAIAADRDFVGSLQLREKVAAIHRSLGNIDAAIEQYQAILAVAQNPLYRASIDYSIAQALLEAGRTDEANEQFTLVFMTYPESFDALSALRALIDADQPIDQYQRGLVNYNQGQYDTALEAFYNHLAATPIQGYTPDVYLYIAQSYREVGNPQAALSELQGLVSFFHQSDGEEWAIAWIELADTYVELGDTGNAFATYDKFVTDYSTLPQAADALYNAALLADSLGDTARAMSYLERLSTNFPDDPRAANAIFNAGIAAYRSSDFERAASLFTSTTAMPANEQPARSNFWLAKAYQAAGQTDSANAAFQNAITASGGKYYGLRAGDILAGHAAFVGGELPLPPIDPEEGRAEAELWIVQTFGFAESPPLAESLRADLSTDPRMVRGRELWDVGMYLEGRQLFEDVRTSYQDDPMALYQLALYFREIGLYRSSVQATSRILNLANTDALSAPLFLGRLRYPLYYPDLLFPYSEQYNLDPLWVYAIIMQESVFEGFAVSTAAAQGLMQIWPPTGEDIAGRLEWPDYRTSDLQRAYVNVAFGTWLLRDELDRFDGNQFAALTAYNAGPGNTATWVERSLGDPDLFVESISLGEPKLYVQRIYEHFEYYRALYGTPPS